MKKEVKINFHCFCVLNQIPHSSSGFVYLPKNSTKKKRQLIAQARIREKLIKQGAKEITVMTEPER